MQQEVALVVAAMDAEATIARAVRSALAQPEAREVIVVDDGSRDRTAAAARACEDGTGRLTVLSLAENRGPSAARNLALEQVTAAWVGVLDADDFLLPGRLGRLLGGLQGAERPDLLADDLLLAEAGAEAGPHRPLGLAPAGGAIDLDLPAFALGNIPDPRRPRREYGFLKPLMRVDFLRRHGLAYEPEVRLGEDYILYAAALARRARFRLGPPCGYVAVAHPGSLSHRHRTEDLRQLVLAEERLLALPGLPPAAVAALGAHRRSVRQRYLHRAMLDAKRQGRYRAALGCLFESPATARYILARTLRDKLASRHV